MFPLLHGILESKSGPSFGFTFSLRTTTDTSVYGSYIPGEPIAESDFSLGKVFFDVTTYGDTTSIIQYGIASGFFTLPVIENETFISIIPGLGITYSMAAGNRFYRAFGYNGVEYFYSTDEIQFGNIKINANYTFTGQIYQFDPINVNMNGTFVNYIGGYSAGFRYNVTGFGALEVDADPYWGFGGDITSPINEGEFSGFTSVYSPYNDQLIWIRPFIYLGGIRYWGELYVNGI